MPEQLPFKQIAEDVDIAQVAQHLNIVFVKNRAPCPACQSSERALQYYPETNSFCCFAAPPLPGKERLGGDCIGFYAHIKGVGQYKAAKALMELFGIASASRKPVPSTPPQAQPEESPRVVAKPERSFDPVSFAGKLAFTDEVKALGLTEDEAKASYIGFYKGHLYLPGPRRGDGAPRGWWKLADGRLVAPVAGWLPDTSNVVALRRA